MTFRLFDTRIPPAVAKLGTLPPIESAVLLSEIALLLISFAFRLPVIDADAALTAPPTVSIEPTDAVPDSSGEKKQQFIHL